MNIIFLLTIVICVFGLGFCSGFLAERATLNVAKDKTTIIYEGSVYVRVIEGDSLEDYLTAAGGKKK
jgi:hypothetical protein